MSLTLKIISPSTLPQGQSQECVFDELGGTIGRKPHNDFVLVDPERFISSKHASIEYKQGKYYITDTSTNGVFINNSPHALGANNSHELTTGDKINIGDFQFQAIVTEQTAAPSPSSDAWNQPPSSPEDSLSSFGVNHAFAQSETASPTDSFSQGLSSDNTVDPLALLGGDSSVSSDQSKPSSVDFGSPTPTQDPFSSPEFGIDNAVDTGAEAEDNFFADSKSEIPPPSPLNEPFTPPSAIPDDWDIMGDDDLLSPQDAKPATPTTPEVDNAEVNDDIFAALDSSPISEKQPQSTPTNHIAESHVSPVADNHSIDAFLADTNIPDSSEATFATAPPPQTPVAAPVSTKPESIKSTPSSSPRESVSKTDDDLLQAFFQGAGIDPQKISFADKHALMIKIGLLTRINTEGLMIALRARSTIKSSFRVNKTIIAPVENNPLKFLVTADDALATLLSDDRTGYMPAKQAVDEGYNDLQTHQMAMMAGMQGTIRAILDQFDPKILEQSFSRSSGSSFIPGSKKSKNWDQYSEFYQRISDQLIDDFQNLFGEEFAKAYEMQVQKLNRSRK